MQTMGRVMLTEVWTDKQDKVNLDNTLVYRGKSTITALLIHSCLNVFRRLVMHQCAVS